MSETAMWRRLKGRVECGACGNTTVLSFDHKGEQADDPDRCARIYVGAVRVPCQACGVALEGERVGPYSPTMWFDNAPGWFDQGSTAE